MTGPPTPPITSAIEIEDLARAENAEDTNQASGSPPAAPVEVAAPLPVEVVTLGTPAQADAPFRRAFASLTDLVAQSKFQQLVEDGEVADLTTTNDSQLERLLVIVPLVLSYLILDDAIPAVLAITRLPDNLKAEPLVQTLYKLSASVSERKYQNVFQRAQEVHEAIQGTAIPNVDFATIANGLLTRFLESFRTSGLVMLSKGYSSLTPATAQNYLGCTREQVLHAATQNKWTYDASKDLLSPVLVSSEGTISGKGVSAGQSSIATLSMIVNSNLE